jgi:hypothetical protein
MLAGRAIGFAGPLAGAFAPAAAAGIGVPAALLRMRKVRKTA